MCGIAGSLSLRSRRTDELREIGCMMGARLRHRGPDDGGTWISEEAGIVLAHRRLSVVDLSPDGHQPMASASGRFVVVFNGEIYNFQAIRDQLGRLAAAPRWRGHSDTEVLLAAFDHWGVERALNHFNGMFALAVWDRVDRCLSLARDRAGEKPLYYGWAGSAFVFASELKALRGEPEFKPVINRDALALFMRHNCVPAPHSIYEGILKLPPGSLLTLDWRASSSRPAPCVRTFWSALNVSNHARANLFRGSEAEASRQLESLLLDAVRLRMQADVPLGAFLSGGIDSSLVVALMQAQSQQPVRTFSIGLEGAANEALYASAVAAHLGTSHTELYVTPTEASNAIPSLAEVYDEPFADSSQIPTLLVSKLARSRVTVALSGDAGDELFGGYNRYVWGRALARFVHVAPAPVRRGISEFIRRLSPDAWTLAFRRVEHLLPGQLHIDRPGDQLHKIATLIRCESPAAVYKALVSHWLYPDQLVLGSTEPSTVIDARARRLCGRLTTRQFVSEMMDLDLITYLADDILVKVDRASMSVGLEVRVPFLDHRVIYFSKRLPLEFLVRGTRGKLLLRSILDRYVPARLFDRPKIGFGIPIDSWLRGALRPWAESLLDPVRLRQQGYLDVSLVRAAWAEHVAGTHNRSYLIWDVLMFQAWLERSC